MSFAYKDALLSKKPVKFLILFSGVGWACDSMCLLE